MATIREIMSVDLITVPPSVTVMRAASAMLTGKVGSVLVVDGSALVGIHRAGYLASPCASRGCRSRIPGRELDDTGSHDRVTGSPSRRGARPHAYMRVPASPGQGRRPTGGDRLDA
jgi:CBS domain